MKTTSSSDPDSLPRIEWTPELLDGLPDNWRVVVTTWLETHNLAEAGRRLGVSRQRAWQIYRRACQIARLARARTRLADLLDVMAGGQDGQAR